MKHERLQENNYDSNELQKIKNARLLVYFVQTKQGELDMGRKGVEFASFSFFAVWNMMELGTDSDVLGTDGICTEQMIEVDMRLVSSVGCLGKTEGHNVRF